MRIAVLADIHGNKPALDAVLDAIGREAVDAVYVLGDVVNGGPEPEACWQAARDAADAVLKGNHERYVLSSHRGDPRFAGESWGPAHWTAQQLPGSVLASLDALPSTLDVQEGPPDGTLLCHASPRADDDLILPDTPDDVIAPMVAGVDAATVVRAHNHVAFSRVVAGVRFVAIGAVGLAFGAPPHAEYAVLESRSAGWHVEWRSVPYDVEATLRACRETGYLEQAGPVARLFVAEIRTGQRYLSRFMREYYRPERFPSLAEAVEAYLS